MIGMMALLQSAVAAVPGAVQTSVASATDNPAATLGLAVVVPFMLQAMKNATWFPWLTRNTSRINFIVGIVAALGATFGIHATWDIVNGGTITIPGVHGLWQGFIQWTGQQTVYKGLVVPAETMGDIRSMLERILTPPPESEGAAKAQSQGPRL